MTANGFQSGSQMWHLSMNLKIAAASSTNLGAIIVSHVRKSCWEPLGVIFERIIVITRDQWDGISHIFPVRKFSLLRQISFVGLKRLLSFDPREREGGGLAISSCIRPSVTCNATFT